MIKPYLPDYMQPPDVQEIIRHVEEYKRLDAEIQNLERRLAPLRAQHEALGRAIDALNDLRKAQGKEP